MNERGPLIPDRFEFSESEVMSMCRDICSAVIREFDGEQEDLVVLVEDVVPELVFAVWLGRGIKKIPERLVVEAHQSARSAYDAAIASGASPCQARRSAVILASLPLLRWIYGHDDWRFLDEDLLWGCAKRWLGR